MGTEIGVLGYRNRNVLGHHLAKKGAGKGAQQSQEL